MSSQSIYSTTLRIQITLNSSKEDIKLHYIYVKFLLHRFKSLASFFWSGSDSFVCLVVKLPNSPFMQHAF